MMFKSDVESDEEEKAHQKIQSEVGFHMPVGRARKLKKEKKKTQ